jgi:O-antigen ligase
LNSAVNVRMGVSMAPPVLKRAAVEARRRNLLFLFSAFLFRIGLALVTFEQVRPFFGIQVSDYCFLISLLAHLPEVGSSLQEAKDSGILLGGTLILSGALLSLHNSTDLSDTVDPFVRLFVLFGLFGPLALIHSNDIRKSKLFLIGGIAANSAIALLQAWLFPGIVDALSINPIRPDMSEVLLSVRFQGLTSHPNILGLSAALAVLVATGLLSFKENTKIRGRLILVVLVCTIAALLSGSRTFFVSLIPGLMVLALLEKWYKRAALRTLSAVFLLSGAVILLVPGTVQHFFERLDAGSDYNSDYSRWWSAVETVDEISQKPIIGWGLDHFNEAGLTLVPEAGIIEGVHNTFLKYWHGMGLLAAVGFLLLFAIPLRHTLGVLKRKASGNSTGALNLAVASFVLLFVVSNLHPLDYNRFLYLPVFVLAGFAARFPAPRLLPRPHNQARLS